MASFDIVLRHRAGGHESRHSFRLEPGQQLVFGRSAQADLVIPDQERRVSSRHGRLECLPDGTLRAFDLASLNGTYLNGVQVDKKAGSALEDTAVLQVGDFELEFHRTAEPAPTAPRQALAPAAGHTTADAAVGAAAMLLRDDLLAAYGACLDGDAAARRAALDGQIDRGLAAAGTGQVNAVVAVLASHFGGGPSATGGAGAAEKPDADGADAAGVDAAGADAAVLRQMAARMVPGLHLEHAHELTRFAQLLEQVFDASLRWLARALEGRGVFAQEFGAEVTMMFQRSTNPLKAMTFEQLKQYLLAATDDPSPETRKHYFEGVLDDLTEHQVGVLAGVQAAVGDVITRLAPERIEAIAEKSKGWTQGTRAWQTYLQVYKELTEERSKLYHDVISPAIQKGYLHRHGERGRGDAEVPPTPPTSPA